MEFPHQIRDAIVSAILGEVASRSVSFLIGKWWKPAAAGDDEGEEERLELLLQRLLLRVRAAVEEAEGRRITSQALLQQLAALSREMHMGYYTLDAFRCRTAAGAGAGAHEAPSSSIAAPSRFSPAKRLCICSSGAAAATATSGGGATTRDQLQQVVGSLEAVVENVAEFILLSGRYPRLFRQTYSMYLILDKCMFGRQMEMEHVMSFLLLHTVATGAGAGRLGVLPILGPGKVGKTTLVEQVCIDDRVRSHFSKTVFFTGDDLVNLRQGRVVKHHHDRGAAAAAAARSPERILIIVELDGDIDEASWTRFHSAPTSSRDVARDSKIIVTSRSDTAARFGTELPLRLRFLTQEAFWYLFKVRTFGSVDAAEHPKLASVAMDIARELEGCFMGASIFGGLLKSNMDAGFWRLVLATYRVFREKNRFLYSAPALPVDPWAAAGPIHIPRLQVSGGGSSAAYNVVVLDIYETGAAQAPEVMVQDVMFGSARPRGKFAALAWRSHLPPHYSYVCNCQRVASRKKKTRNNHRAVVAAGGI